MDKKLTTSKKELYKRVNKYFAKDENSLMCLDEFIEVECPKGYRENKGWIIGVANYLQNTAKYTYEIQVVTGLYIINLSPSYKWDKENLFINKIKIIVITGIITALISLIVSILLYRVNNLQQTQKTTQQDKSCDSLSVEVKNVKYELKKVQDTLAKYKRQ